MRNNSDRLGPQQVPADGASGVEMMPPNPQANENQSLQFVSPTEFVELPSAGKYYPEGHPLHEQSCVEIRYMTAKDEDILTSATLLRKGIALERLLKNILVNKQIDIDSLLLGDKSAIIVAARSVSYGNIYETKVQCPVCTQYSEYEFDLDEATVFNGTKPEELEVSVNPTGTFNLTLPISKAAVEVKLLTGVDEKILIARTQHHKKLNLPENSLTSQICAFVVSVSGNTNPQEIKTFVEDMLVKDSYYLRKTYEKLTPSLDLTQKFICLKCYTENDLEVPLGADFFWLK